MFSTTCTKCGVVDSLDVILLNAVLLGCPLTPDGFAIGDAKQVDTENEWVQCRECDQSFPLADLQVDDG